MPFADTAFNASIQLLETELRVGRLAYYTEAVFEQFIDYYEGEANWKKCLKLVSFAQKQHSYNNTFKLKNIELLLQLQRYTDAELCIDCFPAVSAEERQLLLRLDIDLKMCQQQVEEALELIQEAISETKNEADKAVFYYYESLVWNSVSEMDLAIEALQNCIQFKPDWREAYDELIQCYIVVDTFQLGITYFQQKIDTAPYSLEAWFALGQLYEYCGLYEYSVKAYEYALLIEKEETVLVERLILLHLRMNHIDAAKVLLADYVRTGNKVTRLLPTVLAHFEEQENRLGAMAFIQFCISSNPQDALCYYELGRLFMQQKEYKKAQLAFEKALSLEEVKIHFNALIDCFIKQDKVSEAEELYTQFEALDYCDHSDFETFIIALVKAELYIEAKAFLEERDAGEGLLYLYTLLLLKTGKRQEGLRYLAQVCEGNLEEVEFLLSFCPEWLEDTAIRYIIQPHLENK